MELEIWDNYLTIQFGNDEVFGGQKAGVEGECIHKGFLMYGDTMRWIEPEEKEVCTTQKKQLVQCIINEAKKHDNIIEIEH